MLRGGELKGVGGINKGNRDLAGIEQAKGKTVCGDEVYEVPCLKREERWGFLGKEKKEKFHKNELCFNHKCGAAQDRAELWSTSSV
jgi:hypothetical protein